MKSRRMKVRWVASSLAMMLAFAVSGCAGSNTPGGPAPVSEPSATATPETEIIVDASCPAPECTQVYVISRDELGRARLVPIPSAEDLRDLANTTSPGRDVPLPPETRVKDAVQELMETDPPNQLKTLWRGVCAPADGVRDVTVTRQRITITLASPPGAALCDMSRKGFRLQEQQVAWTAGLGAPVVVQLEQGADYFGGPITAESRYLA